MRIVHVAISFSMGGAVAAVIHGDAPLFVANLVTFFFNSLLLM